MGWCRLFLVRLVARRSQRLILWTHVPARTLNYTPARLLDKVRSTFRLLAGHATCTCSMKGIQKRGVTYDPERPSNTRRWTQPRALPR